MRPEALSEETVQLRPQTGAAAHLASTAAKHQAEAQAQMVHSYTPRLSSRTADLPPLCLRPNSNLTGTNPTDMSARQLQRVVLGSSNSFPSPHSSRTRTSLRSRQWPMSAKGSKIDWPEQMFLDTRAFDKAHTIPPEPKIHLRTEAVVGTPMAVQEQRNEQRAKRLDDRLLKAKEARNLPGYSARTKTLLMEMQSRHLPATKMLAADMRAHKRRHQMAKQQQQPPLTGQQSGRSETAAFGMDLMLNKNVRVASAGWLPTARSGTGTQRTEAPQKRVATVGLIEEPQAPIRSAKSALGAHRTIELGSGWGFR